LVPRVGVQLGDIVPKHGIKLEQLRGKIIHPVQPFDKPIPLGFTLTVLSYISF